MGVFDDAITLQARTNILKQAKEGKKFTEAEYKGFDGLFGGNSKQTISELLGKGVKAPTDKDISTASATGTGVEAAKTAEERRTDTIKRGVETSKDIFDPLPKLSEQEGIQDSIKAQEALTDTSDFSALIERQKKQEAEGTQGIQDLIGQAESLGRVRTDDELRIEREQGVSGIQKTTQGTSRRLEGLLARQGVRGAQAGRQLIDVELQGQEQQNQFRRDLFLGQKSEERQASAAALRDVTNLRTQERGEKAQSLGQLSNLTAGARQAKTQATRDVTNLRLGVAQSDINTQLAEQQARLGFGLATANLSQADQSASQSNSALSAFLAGGY